MTELPVIDRTRLELITRGDAARAAEFLDALLTEAADLLGQLAPQLSRAERSPVADIAHTLKGMAAEVGALRLREAAAVLEAETDPARWVFETNDIYAALGELRAEIGR